MTQDMKKPLAANQGQSPNQNDVTPILPEHAGLVHGIYVAVVQIRGTDIEPRYRKRCYLNLPAANRAIARARMNGLDASIVLCELTPVNGALND
ncbi:hypothetical protein [Glutamicibacter arilaitensis]|uniref:hypothetical protein n=1 Tax=Glutamicibacter arilaitensis TaxID=256701 RepID=UPI003F919599